MCSQGRQDSLPCVQGQSSFLSLPAGADVGNACNDLSLHSSFKPSNTIVSYFVVPLHSSLLARVVIREPQEYLQQHRPTQPGQLEMTFPKQFSFCWSPTTLQSHLWLDGLPLCTATWLNGPQHLDACGLSALHQPQCPALLHSLQHRWS